MLQLQDYRGGEEAMVEGHDREQVTNVTEAGGTATQADLTANTVNAMQTEIQQLLTENRNLKEKLQNEYTKFDSEFFKDDNDKVKWLALNLLCCHSKFSPTMMQIDVRANFILCCVRLDTH
ncbi:PREDICTED: uncharacterized protein LOC106813706 [Priapulus caudatus]|uniref:Uncharacterized protein LOC106813706 n=1 Tax=Priapulus caudatus TaxID=37621 RepID=A0ABM1EMI0_PRICU|nr:PREDICTED: uncharacterized protein LOC106813706 [Priapulus caudatus]